MYVHEGINHYRFQFDDLHLVVITYFIFRIILQSKFICLISAIKSMSFRSICQNIRSFDEVKIEMMYNDRYQTKLYKSR